MSWYDDVTEADEQATDKATALKILAYMVSENESAAIVDMFERAAWGAGTTVEETEAVIRQTVRRSSR